MQNDIAKRKVLLNPPFFLHLFGLEFLVPRLFFALTALAIYGFQPAGAGENAGVELGILQSSAPCGLKGGDLIEFSVLGRHMVNARQVLITFSWQPENAIVGASATLGDGPRDKGLLAPFPPQIEANRAEFGMASFSEGALNGEALLANFSLELAPHVGPETRVEIWLEEVSLGPSFTERDIIRPLQAAILRNYCDTSDQLLEDALFVSPEQTDTFLSPASKGEALDQSSGEVVLRARFFQQGLFAVGEFNWIIENQGDSPIYILAGFENLTLVNPGQTREDVALSNYRGDSLILLDSEPGPGHKGGKALVTVCVELEEGLRCASSSITWAMGTTTILEGSDLQLPQQLHLGQNYPNPFNSTTIFPLFVPAASGSILQIDILNTSGQVVKSMWEEHLRPGHHLIRWDGRGSEERTLASGLYFFRVRQGFEERIRPMVLLR